MVLQHPLVRVLVSCSVALAPRCSSPTADDTGGEGEGEGAGEGEGEGEEIARASCETPLIGIQIDPDIVDGDDAFLAAFAAVDFDSLPETVTLDGLSAFTLSAVAWGLDVSPTKLAGDVDTAYLRGLGIIGDVVLAATTTTPGEFDFLFYRQGLFRYEACAKRWPLTLAGFKQLYGDPTDGTEPVVVTSMPKRPHQRRLWSRPDDGLWLAETLDGDAVKETEIVMQGERVDGALDFIVYDDDGNLSNASRFGTNGGDTLHLAAPYACLACHFDNETFSFTLVNPG